MTRGRAYRLPGTVRPSRYDIHLTANVDEESFDGRVAISLVVDEPAREIVLHARDMTIHDAYYETSDGKRFEGTPAPDPDAEVVAIAFDGDVPASEGTLTLAFTGTVSRNMEGLYLSTDGARNVLASQCEETDARGIYPCFDEPTFKARLKWTVTTAAANTVLTNGVLEDVDENPDGSRTWRFLETNPMSTYLSACCVGPFEANEGGVVNDVPLKVWAWKGKESLGGFGNAYAGKLLPWFEDYFGAPYHYGKYDQIAVPSFSAGAMENPGLVVFREALLLMDPKRASWRQEKLIARIIAHEMAHMWFGNLVTMKWWDDLWLNESFAEWIAHKAVHEISPDYEIWDEFHAQKTGVLATDALESTHSIYSPVETPEQATELFDSITYEKGSAVMRMLENYLGEDAFRRGLRVYMKAFAERNAAGADLWEKLADASQEPVDAIMKSWITQPGYPLLTVTRDAAGLRFRQRRFFAAPGKGEGNDQVWRVPVVVRYEDDAGERTVRFLLTDEEGGLELDVDGELKWLTANAGEIGFYRQALPDDLLAGLLSHLTALTPAERLGLLSDRWALAKAGEAPLTGFMDALDAVARHAREHTVIEGVAGYVDGLEDMLKEMGDDEALQGFRAWVRDVFAPKLADLGTTPREGEDRNDALARVPVLAATAGPGAHEDTIAAAVDLAKREREDPGQVDANLAGVAVGLAARYGDADRFATFVEEYERRKKGDATPQEALRYLYSLVEFRPRALADRTMRLIDEGVVPQEAWGPLLRLALTRSHAQESAWEWMKAHWSDVRARLGDMWTGFLVEHTGHLPARFRDDMERFFDENLRDVAQQARARAFEAQAQRAEFRARVREDLTAWFRARASA